MTEAYQVIHSQFAAAATVSSTVDMKGSKMAGLLVSLVTSATLNLQASYDTTSAHFFDVYDPNGGALMTLDVGSNQAALGLQESALPFPFMRLVAGAAQASVSSFAVVTKLRT